jgi:hypothetical protein
VKRSDAGSWQLMRGSRLFPPGMIAWRREKEMERVERVTTRGKERETVAWDVSKRDIATCSMPYEYLLEKSSKAFEVLDVMVLRYVRSAE